MIFKERYLRGNKHQELVVVGVYSSLKVGKTQYGNSFTKDVTDRLPALLEGSGITTVDLGFIFKPGSEINEHVSIYSTEELTYYSKPVGLNGKWYESRSVIIGEAVNLKKWDIITIQNILYTFSGLSFHWWTEFHYK